MPRQNLAAVIAAYRHFGLTVQVVPGAETRGDPAFNPGCHVGHHTAGPKTGDRPSLSVVVNGRTDLAGPLAQDFLARSGVVYLVATGRANHAGLGGFRGIVGNSGASGTEAEDDGDGVWTDEQLWAYPRLVAARLSLIGRDASWYCSHRTWALTPPSYPGRKIDPTGIADEWMRARVSPLLAAPNPSEVDVPLTQGEWDKLESIVFRYQLAALTGKPNTVVSAADAALLKPASNAQLYELTAYGDSRLEADKAEPHPNSIQRVRYEAAQDRANNAAQFTAILAALSALSGGAVDLDAITAAAERGAAEALSRVELTVAPEPDPAPAPTV